MTVVKYRCKRCGYVWTHKGKPKYGLVPCPICCMVDVEIVEKKEEEGK